MKFGLTEKEIRLISEIFVHFPEVERVFIYGSRAKGNFRKNSDIDLAVKFEKKAEISIVSIKNLLEELPVIYSIDLTDERKILTVEFKKEYEKTKQIFYEKKGSSRETKK